MKVGQTQVSKKIVIFLQSEASECHLINLMQICLYWCTRTPIYDDNYVLLKK